MTVALSTPVTGGAQTGFTSPTYTVALDTSAPSARTKQYAVTAVGGTQTGVRTSTVGDPFTIGYTPPAVLRGPPSANPITGKYGQIPFNVHKLNSRKGVNFAANQVPVTNFINTDIGIGAGGESYDAANIRAMIALHIGALNQFSAGLGDSVVTGIP